MLFTRPLDLKLVIPSGIVPSKFLGPFESKNIVERSASDTNRLLIISHK